MVYLWYSISHVVHHVIYLIHFQSLSPTGDVLLIHCQSHLFCYVMYMWYITKSLSQSCDVLLIHYQSPSPSCMYQSPSLYQSPSPSCMYQSPSPSCMYQSPSPSCMYQSPSPSCMYFWYITSHRVHHVCTCDTLPVTESFMSCSCDALPATESIMWCIFIISSVSVSPLCDNTS